MAGAHGSNGTPVEAIVDALRLQASVDPPSAKLLAQLGPDAASYDQLIQTTMVPNSEGRTKLRVRALIDAASRGLGRPPTLHEWADALFTAKQSQCTARNSGPALLAERAHFNALIRKIRIHVILTPDIVLAIHAG